MVNPYALGIGLRAGYTLPMNLYLGATFIYHQGYSVPQIRGETYRINPLGVDRTEQIYHFYFADRIGDPIGQFWSATNRLTACSECADLAELTRCVDKATAVADKTRQPTLRWASTYDQCGRALLAGNAEAALAADGAGDGTGPQRGAGPAGAVLSQPDPGDVLRDRGSTSRNRFPQKP